MGARRAGPKAEGDFQEPGNLGVGQRTRVCEGDKKQSIEGSLHSSRAGLFSDHCDEGIFLLGQRVGGWHPWCVVLRMCVCLNEG